MSSPSFSGYPHTQPAMIAEPYALGTGLVWGLRARAAMPLCVVELFLHRGSNVERRTAAAVRKIQCQRTSSSLCMRRGAVQVSMSIVRLPPWPLTPGLAPFWP